MHDSVIPNSHDTDTLPSVWGEMLPVRTLRVEVTAGPDAGKTATAEAEQISLGTAEGNGLVLSDPAISRFHAQLTQSEHGVRVEDMGSTNGTFVSGVRIERAYVPMTTTLTLGRTTLQIHSGDSKTVELASADSLGMLCGSAASMRRLFAKINKAAQSDASVLLIGESGTGKEVIARAIHESGPRKRGPLEVVDCASLSPTLVASELFGHERGAFTGAERKHIGAFERAAGGTIFLDEIGELPESLQPALLGVLERKRFRRLGGKEEIPVDVRIVSATHRDLRSEVNSGKFRLDLFYRVSVISLDVPPLRERATDIPLLIAHFLKHMGENREVESIFPAGALDALLKHSWPGNVRELRNVVEATLAMGEAPRLDESTSRSGHAGSDSSEFKAGEVIALQGWLDRSYRDARAHVIHQFEALYLPKLLERTKGNVSQAARDAEMDRSYLWEMLRRHNMR